MRTIGLAFSHFLFVTGFASTVSILSFDFTFFGERSNFDIFERRDEEVSQVVDAKVEFRTFVVVIFINYNKDVQVFQARAVRYMRRAERRRQTSFLRGMRNDVVL